MAEIRREMVFDRTKINVNDAWGSGAIIFSPIKNNTKEGLNHRMLPMLELTTISKGNMTKPYTDKEDFKSIINTEIIKTIKNWNDVKIYDKATSKKVLMYLSLIRFLIKSSNESGDETEVVLSTEDIYLGCNRNIKKFPLSTMLREMDTAGLIKYQKSGAKRLRNWVVSKSFLFV